MEISKSDWKLFRSKLPEWQEAYMERLTGEYIELLSGEGNASDKFWKLDERIKEDRKRTGVIAQISRSKMLYEILELLEDGAITLDDLDGFSDELKEVIQHHMSFWNS